MLPPRLSAALGLAVLLLFGWLWVTADDGQGSPPDILVVGQVAEPKALDPHTVTSLNDFRILANIYDGLVRFRSGTLDIEPGLATDWQVSADGRVYTFRLRSGVRFHDGTPLNAEAVAFNFARMLDEGHPYHDTGPFPLAFFFDEIDAIDTLDARTIRFTLRRPFAPFLSNLAYPAGFIVSPAAVRRHGRTFARHPSGTGPFRLERWDSGVRVVLERNSDYWGGAPALKAVVYRPIRDANTRIAELLAGGIDIVMEPPADMIDILRSQTGFTVAQATGPHLWFLILNTRHGPFRDRRMRQAVNYAIDRRAIVQELLQGTADLAAGPVPRAFSWAHDPELDPYPHDPERARDLIRAAGQEGAHLTLLAAEGGSGMLEPVAMAAAIQADLAKVGLDVDIRTYEWNAYLARVNDGLGADADMAQMAWMTNDPDTLPYLALRSAATPETGGFNSGYYSNPAVDALIEQGRRAVERAQRAEAYRALQRIVHEDAPWAVIASWRQAVIHSTRVTGLRMEPSFLLDLRHVAKPR